MSYDEAQQAQGWERIIPFDCEPISAINEQEAGDFRCGCDAPVVTFIRRDVFPILCECETCGSSWMRNQP